LVLVLFKSFSDSIVSQFLICTVQLRKIDGKFFLKMLQFQKEVPMSVISFIIDLYVILSQAMHLLCYILKIITNNLLQIN
jgi:hypothetical protein